MTLNHMKPEKKIKLKIINWNPTSGFSKRLVAKVTRRVAKQEIDSQDKFDPVECGYCCGSGTVPHYVSGGCIEYNCLKCDGTGEVTKN